MMFDVHEWCSYLKQSVVYMQEHITTQLQTAGWGKHETWRRRIQCCPEQCHQPRQSWRDSPPSPKGTRSCSADEHSPAQATNTQAYKLSEMFTMRISIKCYIKDGLCVCLCVPQPDASSPSAWHFSPQWVWVDTPLAPPVGYWQLLQMHDYIIPLIYSDCSSFKSLFTSAQPLCIMHYVPWVCCTGCWRFAPCHSLALNSATPTPLPPPGLSLTRFPW